MPPDGAATLYAVALRVARLDAAGLTPAGPNNMYVTNTLVKVTFTPVYEAGDETTKKDGQGRLCLNLKQPDTFKRVDINSVELCAEDPELVEILGGGAIIDDGTGDTIGYAGPVVGEDPVPNGVSLEVWTKRFVDNQPAALPFAHYVFPRAKLKPMAKTIDVNPMATDFEGEGYANANWGNGPANDWPVGAPSDRAWQWIAEAAAPAGALGYQATPVQP